MYFSDGRSTAYRIDAVDDEDNLLRDDEVDENCIASSPPLFQNVLPMNLAEQPARGTSVGRSSRKRVSTTLRGGMSSPRGGTSTRGSSTRSRAPRANARNSQGRGRHPHPIDANVIFIEPGQQNYNQAEQFLNTLSAELPKFTGQEVKTVVAEAHAQAAKQIYERMQRELCALLAENHQTAQLLGKQKQAQAEAQVKNKTPVPHSVALFFHNRTKVL